MNAHTIHFFSRPWDFAVNLDVANLFTDDDYGSSARNHTRFGFIHA